MLFIGTNIETSVPLCLTAKLRGLQEARLCFAADRGRYQLRKVSDMEGGRDLSVLQLSNSSSLL